MSVEDFEKACILKDDVKVGPPPRGVNEFFLKWRGTLNKKEGYPERLMKPTPTDEKTARITFKAGEGGKMEAGFVLVEGGTEGGFIRFMKAEKIGDGKHRGPNDPSIEELWEQKKFVPPPPPPPPRLWPWTSPLPASIIEAPPVWAWDVLGK